MLSLSNSPPNSQFLFFSDCLIFPVQSILNAFKKNLNIFSYISFLIPYMHIYMKFTSVWSPPFVFRDLAWWLTNWSEDILISCFKDWLKNDLYNVCVLKGGSPSFTAGTFWAKKWRLTRHATGIAQGWKSCLQRGGVSKAAELPAVINRLLQMWSGGASGSRVQEQMTHQTDHPGPTGKVAKPP